ncbi:MAG: hypothetical protein A2Y62_02750 [Candidatus Fischerbacteria bacterium RBG_13_37_8]|uniref:Methyltransferase domain-containing protein n=1 Tax=Candidatus Fischerbacteria bacterium RBG_13_37_8 TaxID=1817863 RepID=A0A1F5VXU0_9BACT|nr:MAG: hypothetical protein A2Y62_02750 [Candidatus Fischerbacteria bacterium RBG_13_37_8]
MNEDFKNTIYKELFSHETIFWQRVNFNYRILSSIKKSNKTIFLDYGCGWGFFIFCLAAFGAKKIIGIDIRKNEIEIAKKIKDAIFHDYDIQFYHRSTLDYQESIDVMFFNNVLSHVKLPVEYLMKAYSILNYQGVISIYDNNNGLSLLVHYRNKRLWNRNEHELTKQRENIFMKNRLTAEKAQNYALMTRGLSEEDCLALLNDTEENIETYLITRENVMPTHWLDSDIVDERIINPIIYKHILSDMGFENIDLRSDSYNYPISSNILNKIGIGLFIYPAFHMTAEKRRLPLKKK